MAHPVAVARFLECGYLVVEGTPSAVLIADLLDALDRAALAGPRPRPN